MKGVSKFKINLILIIALAIIVILSGLCIFLSVKIYNQKAVLKNQEQTIEDNKDKEETNFIIFENNQTSCVVNF